MAAKNNSPEHIKICKDEFGKDIILKDGFLQVMMEWEKPYMEACIDALKPSGDVLEIGFGLGYSATRIQQFKPKSHTIIECEPIIIEKGKEWAKQFPDSKIIFVEGLWQDKLKDLGQYDAIFFDDYSPLSEKEVEQIERGTREMQEVEKKASSLHDAIKAMMQSMKGIKFSDAQVMEFAEHLLTRKDVDYDVVVDFIQNLAEQGNITPQQEVKFLDEYEKKGKTKSKPKSTVEEVIKFAMGDQAEDRLLQFYKLCLDNHLKKGGRMSSYVDFKQFKKHHEKFNEMIASRRDVAYSQAVMHVDVPENCQYYVGNEALILTITKH